MTKTEISGLTDEEWIESFYSFLESGLDNYTRPVDYKERAYKILNGTRKPVQNQYEGHTGVFSDDH